MYIVLHAVQYVEIYFVKYKILNSVVNEKTKEACNFELGA